MLSMYALVTQYHICALFSLLNLNTTSAAFGVLLSYLILILLHLQRFILLFEANFALIKRTYKQEFRQDFGFAPFHGLAICIPFGASKKPFYAPGGGFGHAFDHQELEIGATSHKE